MKHAWGLNFQYFGEVLDVCLDAPVDYVCVLEAWAASLREVFNWARRINQ